MPESDHNSKVALSTRGARAVHKTRHLSYSRFHYSHYRKCQNLTFKGGRWKNGKVETRTFLCQKRWRNLSAKKWRLGTDETASEVVREGLRLLKQRDEVWKADVRDKIKQGMDSIRAGRTIPAEQVQAEMTAFKKKWKKNRNVK